LQSISISFKRGLLSERHLQGETLKKSRQEIIFGSERRRTEHPIRCTGGENAEIKGKNDRGTDAPTDAFPGSKEDRTK